MSKSWDLAEEDTFALSPGEEAFALRINGDVSFAEKRLPLAGRLQIWVSAGSQYATWRQFPAAIRYEVREPLGGVSMTPDLSLSISDSSEMYAGYGERPCDQVVGQNFEADVFATLCGGLLSGTPTIPGPGRYQIRAHHMGRVSNWVDVDFVT